MKTLVVNLFGAPGAGKSTGAAAIFSICTLMVNSNLFKIKNDWNQCRINWRICKG